MAEALAPHGGTPHRLRVINLGLPKSGTTTLGRALKRSGLKVADHRIRHFQTEQAGLGQAFVGDILYRGYYHTGDPLALLGEFDAISEMSFMREDRSAWPQMDFGLIAAIEAHHPGVRFIATRRDARALSRSMLGWSNMASRLPRAEIPGLPRGYGETGAERMVWIDAHYAHLARLFAGRDNFLELDVAAGDARARLQAFLDRPLPWWGRANVTKPAAKARRRRDASDPAPADAPAPRHQEDAE